jgi:hypothetical protein
MRVRQRDDLARVAGVGKDFLVPGDGGIEDHLTDGVTGGADRISFENGSVSQREDGWNGRARKKWRQGQLPIKLP